MAATDPPIPAIKPTDPVCFYCSRQKDAVDPWEFQILDIGRLKSGADLNCATCDLRYRAVSCYHSEPEQRVIFQSDPKRLTFDRRQFFEVFRLAESDPRAFPTIQTGYALSRSTASAETLAKVKSWIGDCKGTHESCRARDCGEGYMPKRIIHLSNGNIALMEGVKPHTYACLSHCWGPSQSLLKTLSTTIDDLKKNVPWISLSKTFQDAIDICRRLDIQYIWIDSLCIIQDSDEDWAEESAKMADIYANAFLTIAATKSKDGAGGCYSDRDARYVDCGTVVEGSVYIRGQIPRFGGPAGSKAGEEGWPLLLRGWVYQEMSLSARVLHFGRQEVVWQCRTHRRSESGSNDSDYAKITFGDGHAPPEGRHNDAWDEGSPNDRPWYDAVNDYSGLALSFDKDKLPALAAISQGEANNRSADDRFLAGLWNNSFLLDMLWEVYPQNSANGPVKKPANNSAPSWSWASVKSRVKWFMFKNYMSPHYPLDCTKLEAVYVEPIGSPYLGRYSRCELIFRGPLISTTSAALEGSIFMSNAEKENRGHESGEVMAVHQFTPDYTFDLNGSVYGPATSSNFILPLMLQHGGNNLVVGIVIRPTGDSIDAYERVGLAILVYVKRGPPIDIRPDTCQEWDYHPWRPITRQWINSYLSSLPKMNIILR
ncbi:putative tol protein [Rosellinia necatrix]|uniref:Putative tol protein n=1 Tax=Rosellinia necatrix TaxID=77044 RepID=A0A1S7URV5_ROSNE|nr:putative tol protein [Rosellinia necatrix]